jgi:hypothetical protein
MPDLLVDMTRSRKCCSNGIKSQECTITSRIDHSPAKLAGGLSDQVLAGP